MRLVLALAAILPSTALAQECPAGRQISIDTHGHCCWPGQAWSRERGECIGIPRCPQGFVADGATCASTQPEQPPPSVEPQTGWWPPLTATEAQRTRPALGLGDFLPLTPSPQADQQIQTLMTLINHVADDNPEKAELLYRLASLLLQTNKAEQARTFFKQLVERYPASAHVPSAFAALGEYHFATRDFENALKFFDGVVQFPRSPAVGYARIMRGWCYFDTGDFRSALAAFIGVLAQPSSDGRVQSEARKDVVRTYARMSDANPQRAWPLFQRYGGTEAAAMLEQLAEYYRLYKRWPDVVLVRRQEMLLSPTSDKLCDWQMDVVDATSQSHPGPDAQVVKALQRLVEVSRKASGPICVDRAQAALRATVDAWRATGGPNAAQLIALLEKELQQGP